MGKSKVICDYSCNESSIGMRSKHLWHISLNSSHKVLTGLVIECFSRKQLLKFHPIDLIIVVISVLDHTSILRLDILVSWTYGKHYVAIFSKYVRIHWKLVCISLYLARYLVSMCVFVLISYVYQIYVFIQGRRKQPGCSGFAWTSFSQGKNKLPFLQRESNK